MEMTVDQKFELVKRNTAEIIGEEELKKLLNVKNVVTIYDVDFRIKKMITFEIGDQLTVDSTIQQLELVGILRKYIEVVNKTDPTIKR